MAGPVFVLFGSVIRYSTNRPAGPRASGSDGGIHHLFGSPHSQLEPLAWPVLLVVVVVICAFAAQRGRQRWLWGAGLALVVFTIVGMTSIGLVYAPAAHVRLVATVVAR